MVGYEYEVNLLNFKVGSFFRVRGKKRGGKGRRGEGVGVGATHMALGSRRKLTRGKVINC
jgi:hypothetical protein